MDWDLKITDMAGATPEHSAVIVNFVAAVRHQLRNSTCYVYSDNVQYRFKDEEGNNKIVVPDASINCRTKSRRGNTFTDAPRFVMEVLSHATEDYDRHEKMNIYCKVGVSEYWIADWRKKQVEIYLFDFKEDGGARKLLKSMNWIMMEKFQNTSSGKPSQKKIKTSYTCSIFQISRSLLTSYLRKLIINGYITDRF